MKSLKEFRFDEATKQQQLMADKLFDKMNTRKLTPEQWEQFFSIISKADKAGLDLGKLSNITMHNFNQWKKRNGK